MSADLDVELLRASFVQAQSQILNDGRFEPVVVVSKALALQLLDEIDRLRQVDPVDLVVRRLAEAFVDVWSQPDPMVRAVRGHQVFGKSFGHMYAGTADVDQVARALTRAIKRQP